MVYPKVLGICIVLAFAFNFVKCTKEPEINVVSVQNITAFFEENPSIKVRPLIVASLVKDSSTKFLINYQLGKRINGKKKSNIFNKTY